MIKLYWQAKVGGIERSGEFDMNKGVNRLLAELPQGKIEYIRAHMKWFTDTDEKLFMNGYQTWTYCPEYGMKDKIRGVNHIPKLLLKKYAFDRYGDYHFIKYGKKSGMTHGFSYCYFRKGDVFRLFASIDERHGYTVFRYDSNKQVLMLERDCEGVMHNGGEFPLFEVYYDNGDEKTVFDGWFNAMGCHCRTNERIAGYSSWYNRYQNIDEKTVASDLKGCRSLLSEGDVFQIDDGWQPYVGDWLESESLKFPSGMKNIADDIHSSGFKAGIWLAPFVCETKSDLFKNHPDWLFKRNGKPWCCGGNWSKFYALDIDNPDVRGYLSRVFERVLNDWGFDLVKLDFLYGAAPFGTDYESRAGRMIRAMEMLRNWCGEKLIIGCGVPIMPAFGLVDYCRVGCDVSLDWDDVWYMRLFHRERVSTFQSMSNTIFRRQLNGRAYGSDPDVFFLRDDNIKLTREQKDKLSVINALFGNVLLTSDDISLYNEAMYKKYKELLEIRDASDVKVINADRLTVSYAKDGKKYKIVV